MYEYLIASYSPRQFLSSGCDLVVKMWEILDHDDNDERKGLDAMRSSESIVPTITLVLILALPLLEYSHI